MGSGHVQQSHSDNVMTVEGQVDEERLRDWELTVTVSNVSDIKGHMRSEVNEAG